MDKEKYLELDVNENPKRIKDWILFAIQHILAMLVACITVPVLTGLPIGATLISAGIGTICYILFTKKKSPVFLSSSFAYLAPMSSALAIGLINDAGGKNYLALIIGMFLVGLIYVIVGLVIKFTKTDWLNKLLPPKEDPDHVYEADKSEEQLKEEALIRTDEKAKLLIRNIEYWNDLANSIPKAQKTYKKHLL